MVRWSCSRASGSRIQEVKMQIGAWLLWLSWLCTWAEFSLRCTCQDVCPTECGLDRRSRSRVREHVGHGEGHQHTHHRSRPQRRKGSRLHAQESPPRIVHHPSDVVVKSGNPASLSCRADGSPRPTIEWLRNGQPVDMRHLDGHLQALVLPEGSLFFLSVGGGGRRGPSHEGIYTCVARSSAGEAISRNASLYIAVLKEEFSEQPSDVEVAEGEVAVFNCGPPTGHPEPNVSWRRNGLPIVTDQHYTELSGKLIIAAAEKSHSGSYVCVASNTEGERQSRAARLSVLARPVLVLKPENVSVRTGDSAQFYCRAKGDPPPAVVWSREQGPLPNGRYLVNPDQTLQIHYVTAQDAGKYTCTAVNDVGVVTASAQLQVEESSSSQRDLHKELSALRVSLENVTIVAPGSNSSQVQWKLQSLPAQPHYLDGFEVLYRSLLPASSDWAAKKVTLPSFQTQVGPLKRGYKYEFKVRPYGSNLYGRESNTRHLRVPETVPSAPPVMVSITVSHEQNNTIHLSWEPPPHDAHNGIIQGYQVWCVESEEQQSQNWTVDSGHHHLDISALKPGRRYWITIAAVNGAGVGALSDPHGFIINPQTGPLSESDSQRRDDLSQVLALLQDPVLIGTVGALLWCLLMVAAVFLFRRHSRTGHLLSGHGRAKGLHRLANEDLIIKHRMAAPDSPWISGGWRPAFNQKYQDLWAQGQKHPGLRSTSLPVSWKDQSRVDSAVPIVTDSCGVYGTFYVDLMATSGLKTFNSPGRVPKMPHGVSPQQGAHGLSPQQGAETIQIFPQPAAKSSPLCGSREALPWKQAIRPQPKMGVLREAMEKSYSKTELHAVNSVPIVPTRRQACPSSVYKQRLSHVPSGRHECDKVSGCPRLLHYSASLHLVDMLPPPPPMPVEDTTDTHSLSSDEGSSRSTKLTVDLGSLQSVCAPSGHRGQPNPSSNNNNNNNNSSSFPSYSHLSTASYCRSMDEEQSGTLTAQEATQYLELSPRPERCSALPQQHPSLPHLSSSSLGFIRGPGRSLPQLEDDPPADEPEARPVGLRRARLQSSPSSCYSEWDSSLWNTWSSAMDSNMASARTSLISSVDSCYTNDSANFVRLLAAAAAESMSGASLSDFSPPASPLSALYPPFCGDGDSFGELEPVPAWDWSMAWVEEMEAQYRAQHHPGRNTKPFDS